MQVNLVALIPESTRKEKGGNPSQIPVDLIAEILPDAPRRKLLALREHVSAKSPAGTVRSGGLLPAYLRFQGNMYRHIAQEVWEQRRPDVEVIIACGLRGLVASRDTVPAYAHSMAEPMPPFGKLNRWWRDNGLPEILAAYFQAVRPKTVVDLLSLEYREAVEGYADGLRGIAVKTIDFPGMGRASQPRRGEKVTEILRTGKA